MPFCLNTKKGLGWYAAGPDAKQNVLNDGTEEMYGDGGPEGNTAVMYGNSFDQMTQTWRRILWAGPVGRRGFVFGLQKSGPVR